MTVIDYILKFWQEITRRKNAYIFGEDRYLHGPILKLDPNFNNYEETKCPLIRNSGERNDFLTKNFGFKGHSDRKANWFKNLTRKPKGQKWGFQGIIIKSMLNSSLKEQRNLSQCLYDMNSHV